jgi:hypothetical protein
VTCNLSVMMTTRAVATAHFMCLLASLAPKLPVSLLQLNLARICLLLLVAVAGLPMLRSLDEHTGRIPCQHECKSHRALFWSLQ